MTQSHILEFNDVAQSPLVYEAIDGGIHRFTFNEATKATADQFTDSLDGILKATPSDERLLIMIDIREKGLPPINYTFTKLRQTLSANAPLPKMYSAYLYRQSVIITLVTTFLDILRSGATRRFFADGQENEAIDWLLSMRQKETV